MANLPRVLVQLLFVGTRIVGRAFVEAYQKAAASKLFSVGSSHVKDSAQNAAANAARSQDSITRKTGMDVDEALQILHIPKENMKLEEVVKRYEQLFKLNDSESGGSFYLQSKVVRARERLELEIQRQLEKQSTDPKAS